MDKKLSARICVNLFMKEKVVTVSDADSLSLARGHMSITLYPLKTMNCLSLIQTISCFYVQNVIQLLKTKQKTKKFSLRISIEAPLSIFKIFSRGEIG